MNNDEVRRCAKLESNTGCTPASSGLTNHQAASNNATHHLLSKLNANHFMSSHSPQLLYLMNQPAAGINSGHHQQQHNPHQHAPLYHGSNGAHMAHTQNMAIGLPTPSSSLPSSSSASSTTSSSFSISKLCSNTTANAPTQPIPNHGTSASPNAASNSLLLTPSTNLQQAAAAVAAASIMNNPLNIYQFLNSAGVQSQSTDTPFNFLNTSPWHLFQQQQQQNVVGSDSAASKLTMLNNALMSKANETSHKQRGLGDGISKKSHMAHGGNFQNEEGEEENEYLNEESEDADDVGVDVDDEDDDDEDDVDDDDEEEEYDVDDHAFNPTAASQSATRSKQSAKQAAHKHKANEASVGAGSSGGTAFASSIKLEQNEKTIKKNKVIELYTKGERCVRKLSQLTGVPLTTVYRVIGKLKGINYNIPRGNGAGRKTILDAQDREILVEILNAQPRISRKALGKELEKRTGKSIHNSTLNRELCRLRHHGHNFAATVAAADLIANSNSGNNKNAAHLANNTLANSTNYMKHFANNDTYAYKESSNSSFELRSSTSNAKALQRYTAQMRSDSNETNEDESTLDNDKLMRQVVHESKRLGNNLSQSEIECKSVANMPNELSKLIIEICQMSTTHLSSASSSLLLQARLDKIHTAVDFLLNDHFGKHKSDNKDGWRKSAYEIYLSEACVQLCQLKPTLLTRPDDLVNYATRILENCSIFEEREDKEALGGSLRNGKR